MKGAQHIAKPRLWRRAALLLPLYAGLWWLLTDGDISSWILGVPGVVLASAASVYLTGEAPSQPIRWRGLPRFARFFLWESLLGGMDVARRAFQSRMALAPELLEHKTRLPAGPARVFFAVSASLLPGTLTTDLNDCRVIVHVLDRGAGVPEDLQRLESHTAALFGLDSGAGEADRGEQHLG